MIQKYQLSLLILWLGFSIIQSHAWATVSSSTGNIQFDVNDDQSFESTLTHTGLGIGTNLTPTANLHVDGNTIISENITIGSNTQGSANLFAHGTWSQSVQIANGNTTIDSHSLIMAGNSSGNIFLNLPSVDEVGNGRIFHIKKTVSEHNVFIGGNGLIDHHGIIRLTSGSYGQLKVIGYGSTWHILSISGNGSVWTPDSISTIAWYDPSNLNSLSLNSGNVSQMNDLSGNDNHVTEGDATEQPASGNRTINGLNVLAYDGVDDVLTNTALSGVSASDKAALVILQTDDDTGDARPLGFSTGSGNGSFTLFNEGSMAYCHNGSYPRTPDVSRSSDAHVIFFGRDDSTVNYIIRDGGAESDSDTHVPPALIHPAQIDIGQNGRQFDGKMGEIIFIDAPDTTTRQKLEGYLAWKWGLAGQFPSSHPYKHFPPILP